MHRSPTIALVCLALCACTDGTAPGTPAADIHTATLTLDSHVDIPLDFATEAYDPLDGDMAANLERMREGGLDAAFFISYVGQTERTAENYAQARTDAMRKFAAIHRMTQEMYPELIELAYRADDVERIVAAGKLAAAIGIENGYVIGNDLDMLDQYYELGGRYMTLVHDGHNDIADSARPEEDLGDSPTEHGGVSAFGERVIERMNALGMMVDISHGSKQTALDAIRLSRAPVIASHSSVDGVREHARNLDDETLRAVRDDGGVVQIVAYDAYVHGDETLASLEQLVDHIDYAVDLIGIDHVGISSDFGGGGGVIGWTGAHETPNLTAELVERGYGAEDIAKLWSGNLLRVWREAERVAAER